MKSLWVRVPIEDLAEIRGEAVLAAMEKRSDLRGRMTGEALEWECRQVWRDVAWSEATLRGFDPKVVVPLLVVSEAMFPRKEMT